MRKRKQNIQWGHHTLEFITVVIGILIAFQLNKCSVDKNQKTTISTHLDQLKVETRLNKKNLTSIIDHSETNLVLLDSLLTMLKNPDLSDYDAANQITFRLMNIGKVYLRKNAYKSLVESGDVRFIKDFDTKNRIINLYEYYAWVEGIEGIAIDNYNARFFPYLSDNLDLVNASIQQEEVYTSKVFLNALATYRYSVANKLTKYKECLEVINQYLEFQEQ